MYMILIFLLYIVQLFIVKPGSDISGSFGEVSTYSVNGLSYSAIVCMLLVGYLLLRLLVNIKSIKGEYVKNMLFVIIYILLGIIVGLGHSTPNAIDYVLKMILPFIVYYYMECSARDKEIKYMPQLITVVNAVMLGQILVCKMLTGHYSASTYYTYLHVEEYFGYYNSPHPLSALLGLLSLWNLYNIQIKRQRILNVIMFFLDLFTIILLGVRTYMLASAAAIAIMILCGVYNSKYKEFTVAALIIMVVIVVCIYANMDVLFAGTRVDSNINKSEITSGRNDRWGDTIKYIIQNYGFTEILLGKGFQNIYAINSELGNGYINSLNFIIDVVADNGIIGLALLITAYYRLIKNSMSRKYRNVQYGIIVFLVIGMFLNNLLPYVTIMPMSVIMLSTIKKENRSLIN